MDTAGKLRELLREHPDATELSLEGEDLEELDSLVDLLARFGSLQSLNLSRNTLQALPNDLARLRSLQELDISSNAFPDISAAMHGLVSLPALRSLNVTLSTEEEEEQIFMNLPNLRRLNGLPLDDEAEEEDEEDERVAPASMEAAEDTGAAGEAQLKDVQLTQDDLEEVAVLFGTVKALKGAAGSAMSEEEMAAAFDGHIQGVMGRLGRDMQALEDPFLRQARILAAKHELFDLCFRESCEHASLASREFGDVLRKLREVHGELFADLHAVAGAMPQHYAGRIAEMQNQVSRAEHETREILSAAGQLEQEVAEHAEEKKRLAAEWERERASLVRENRRLKSEREQGAAQGGPGTFGPPRGSAAAGGKAGYASGAAARRKAAAPGAGAGPASPAVQGRSPQGFGGPSPSQGPGGASSSRVGEVVRSLSLKQLIDYVEAIYASKVKFDAKCADARLPRETMEQHMYTFLNQRYGLKSLIVDHATAIHKAAAKYEAQSNDVAVFGKILRNEIDEEFHQVQRQVKDTAKELLRVYLKGKFPLKSDDAVRRMHEERMRGDVYEEEWADIVQYMYNAEDAARVIERVRARVKQPPPEKPRTRGQPRGKLTPEEAKAREEFEKGPVPWKAFVKTLLDFQLESHDRFLSKFRSLFQKFDNDSDGVVNEPAFRSLVAAVDPSKTEQEFAELLEGVDPFNNEHITFSDCVAALSNEIVAMSAPVGGYELAVDSTTHHSSASMSS